MLLSITSINGGESEILAVNHSSKGELRTETVFVKVTIGSALHWLLFETLKAPFDCSRLREMSLVNRSSLQEHTMKIVKVRRASINPLEKANSKC